MRYRLWELVGEWSTNEKTYVCCVSALIAFSFTLSSF
jgi:hypothetical protein